MQKTSIKYNNKKSCIYSFLDYKQDLGEQEEFIMKEVEKSTQKAFDYISCNKCEILLFATESDFVKDKMGCVSGRAREAVFFQLCIHPEFNEDNLESLQEVVLHEYNHAVRFHFFSYGECYGNVLRHIIQDGMAENFAADIMDKEKTRIAKGSGIDNRGEAQEVFRENKGMLYSEDEDFRYKFFYSEDDFPLWSGYAIGFYLVKDYLNNLEDYEWGEIIKKDAEEVLEVSGW
ncbi:MAG: DUF2268 domain-containing putative Zn-dependent protease [Candidatus Magasanikbacteria bacterium]